MFRFHLFFCHFHRIQRPLLLKILECRTLLSASCVNAISVSSNKNKIWATTSNRKKTDPSAPVNFHLECRIYAYVDDYGQNYKSDLGRWRHFTGERITENETEKETEKNEPKLMVEPMQNRLMKLYTIYSKRNLYILPEHQSKIVENKNNKYKRISNNHAYFYAYEWNAMYRHWSSYSFEFSQSNKFILGNLSYSISFI